MSFGRTYWILIAFCLAPVIPLSFSRWVCVNYSFANITSVTQLSAICLFVGWSFFLYRYFFLGGSLLLLLLIFPLAFSNVRLVWPASSAVTVMQSSTCMCALCLCVSPKLVCNCRWAFEFGVHFAKHSTLGQTFLTFCMNIKPTWDISLGSTHREKHA